MNIKITFMKQKGKCEKCGKWTTHKEKLRRNPNDGRKGKYTEGYFCLRCTKETPED
jgi:predicted ATP-dependent serine protease